MSDDHAHHVSGDFTELQRALLGTQTIEQFLQEVALLAARLVPDGMSCGMTMRPNGRPVTGPSPMTGSRHARTSPALHASTCAGAETTAALSIHSTG